MTTQTDLPIVPLLDSIGRRKIAATSLRPGSWLAATKGGTPRFCILQNGAAKGHVEAWSTLIPSRSYPYSDLNGLAHAGVGQPRRWWPMLPKWLKSYVAPFSQP